MCATLRTFKDIYAHIEYENRARCTPIQIRVDRINVQRPRKSENYANKFNQECFEAIKQRPRVNIFWKSECRSSFSEGKKKVSFEITARRGLIHYYGAFSRTRTTDREKANFRKQKLRRQFDKPILFGNFLIFVWKKRISREWERGGLHIHWKLTKFLRFKNVFCICNTSTFW